MSRASGYHRVGQLMGAQTDLAIFRKFLGPNAINILLMEAEIIQVYDDLQVAIRLDRQSQKPEQLELERCFSALRDSADSAERNTQYNRVMELRRLLKDYNEALLTFKNICALPPAEKGALETLRAWFGAERGQRFLGCALENNTWDETTESDLTSLTGRYHDSDLLSKFIDGTVISWLHERFLRQYRKPVELHDSLSRTIVQEDAYNYSEGTFSKMIGVLSMTTASLIPTVSIFALFFVKSPIARMGVIVAFTFLFSAAVTVVTTSKRVECFVATAAFAAVLVVFVSNNNSVACTC